MIRLLLTMLLCAPLSVGCFGGGGEGTGSASKAPKKPRYAIILDRSSGMQDKDGRACDVLELLLNKVLDDKGRNRLAKATVYLTGTKKNVGAPILGQVNFKELIAHGGLEASKAAGEKAEAKRAELVTRLLDKCRSEAPEVNYSPLFHALRGVVSDMQQQCGEGSACKVFFYTDLQEIAEPWMCTEIFGAKWYGKKKGCPSNKGRSKPKKVKGPDGKRTLQWAEDAKPKPVDASNVSITICGVNQSADASSEKMGPGVAERRDQVWSDLFEGATDFRVLGSCESL